jgi:hypothetical protein
MLPARNIKSSNIKENKEQRKYHFPKRGMMKRVEMEMYLMLMRNEKLLIKCV